MSPAIFDVERRLAAFTRVELDAIKSVLVANEVDVIVVSRVSDLEALDYHTWCPASQLVEQFVQRSASPV